jgi:DNA polymerase-3 subunit beta
VKFRCERDVLVEALGIAGRAVSGRGGSLPALSGVRADLHGDALRVTGSDLDLTITVSVTVAGESDGLAVIPARLASDIVRALEPGAVHIEADGDELRIRAGRGEFGIRLITADEFPQVSDLAAEPVSIDAEQLAGALRQVVPAASTDDSRPILTGVLLAAEGSGLRLVATDSYRLALRDVPGVSVLAEGQSVLVPSRALAELNRVLAHGDRVQLRLGPREACFDVGPVRLATRLIEGDFPNYRGLIPTSHPNSLVVARDDLLDALRRVRLLAREATPVRLEMSEDGLELVAITQDVGQAREQVEGSFEGSPLTVAFNPQYLLDGIEVAPGDQVRLSTIDELKPALVRSIGHDDFLYLLMPVRVS